MGKNRESSINSKVSYYTKEQVQKEKDFKFFKDLMSHDSHKRVNNRIKQTKWEK